MNSWSDVEKARSRYATLLREAEVGRMLRSSGLLAPGLRERMRDGIVGWAVGAHRRLHELDGSLPARREGPGVAR